VFHSCQTKQLDLWLTESGEIEIYGDKNLVECLKMMMRGIEESKVNSFEKTKLFSDIGTMFETLRASYQFWLDLTPNGIITMKAFNELYKLAMDPSRKIRNLLLIANLDDYSVVTNLCWLNNTEDPRHLSPSQKYEILKAIARRLQIEY